MKPDNFAMGLENADVVHIIDYGLAKRIFHGRSNEHVAFATNKRLTGTARYASLNTHFGYEQSRRDDLESLGYTLIYLMRGRLPWQGVSMKNKQERYDSIRECKMDLSLSTICSGLPEEMARYMGYCRNLNFDQRPDYRALKKLFEDYFVGRRWDVGFQFDWELAKSEEGHKKLRNLDFAVILEIKV